MCVIDCMSRVYHSISVVLPVWDALVKNTGQAPFLLLLLKDMAGGDK